MLKKHEYHLKTLILNHEYGDVALCQTKSFSNTCSMNESNELFFAL